MQFSWEKIKKPIVALAPMAGYTDSAFRQIAKEIAPEIICFSELTSTNAIAYGSKNTKKMLEFAKSELPLIIQLFGNKKDFFMQSAKILEDTGISGIDVNMGCPVKKVVNLEQGSALLKDPDLAAEIIHSLTKTVKIPISVKTRIGYEKYDPEKLLSFAKKMEEAGAKLLTIHGRTKSQGFSGEATFDPIYLVKQHLKIPVIGNGDIDSAKKAVKMLKNKKVTLDGLMIGRAVMGNPWILAEIYAKLHKKTYSSPKTLKEKIPLIKKHFLLSIETHGEKKGILEMRKHLSNYIKDIPNASFYRVKLIKSENPQEIIKILDSLGKHEA